MKAKTIFVTALLVGALSLMLATQFANAQPKSGTSGMKRFPEGTRARLATGYKFVKKTSGSAVVYRQKETGVNIQCSCDLDAQHQGPCDLHISDNQAACYPEKGGGCDHCHMYARIPQNFAAAIHFESANRVPVRSQ